MTHDFAFDDTITTPEEFEVVLGELLSAATGNGFDPEGSWVYRSDGASSDWEVMVMELERRPADG